jgi:hypothetical protein
MLISKIFDVLSALPPKADIHVEAEFTPDSRVISLSFSNRRKVTTRSFVFRTINMWRGRHRWHTMQLFDTPDPAATPASMTRRRSLKWRIS